MSNSMSDITCWIVLGDETAETRYRAEEMAPLLRLRYHLENGKGEVWFEPAGRGDKVVFDLHQGTVKHQTVSGHEHIHHILPSSEIERHEQPMRAALNLAALIEVLDRLYGHFSQDYENDKALRLIKNRHHGEGKPVCVVNLTEHDVHETYRLLQQSGFSLRVFQSAPDQSNAIHSALQKKLRALELQSVNTPFRVQEVIMAILDEIAPKKKFEMK